MYCLLYTSPACAHGDVRDAPRGCGCNRARDEGALERIAESLSAPKQSLSADFVADPDFLHDLYYGDYEPSVFKTQSEHQKQLNHNASMAEELLRQKMGNSPEAMAAFEAYQLAAGECSSIVAEQAFESGFQTAVQMLVAGLKMCIRDSL